MALSADLLDRIRAHLGTGPLLAPGEPVLALVSGGADSTLLLCALAGLGHPVEALHVAHALRGDESEADAAACRALAQALDVPLHVADGAVADGPNLEARARDARRSAALARAGGRAVATGHTADDRVETILYRLAASRGPQAFAALPARDGAFIRPLLLLGRAEVRDALRAAGVGWREDASNADRRFARNRIRADVLPALAAVHPGFAANLLATAADVAEEREALAAAAGALLTDDGRSLDTVRAAAAPPALARAALRLLAGPPAPPRTGLDRALALCRSTAGTARVPLDGGRVAERRYDRLVVLAAGEPGAPPAPARLLVPGRTRFGDLTVVCTPTARGRGLDPRLAPQLVLRQARPGERLAGRRSTLRRLLAEARVPAPLRPAYPVVAVGDEAVCLPGVALAPDHARPGGLDLRLEPSR